MTFKITRSAGFARRGELTTKSSSIQTPVFMPVGTYGTVKGLTPDQLHEIGFEIILGNAFHLVFWMYINRDFIVSEIMNLYLSWQ